MALAIVEKGEECMTLLESLSNDIEFGRSGSSVDRKLVCLKRYGKELADHAEERAKECEKVEQQCKEKVKETQREIEKLAYREEQVKSDMQLLSQAMSSHLVASSVYARPLSVKLYLDLDHLKEQSKKYNTEAKRLKEIVLFFLKSSQFWREFRNISNDGRDRVSLVQDILARAKTHESNSEYMMKFFNSNTTKKVTKTFFDTWKAIETKYGEGVMRLDQEKCEMLMITN